VFQTYLSKLTVHKTLIVNNFLTKGIQIKNEIIVCAYENLLINVISNAYLLNSEMYFSKCKIVSLKIYLLTTF